MADETRVQYIGIGSPLSQPSYKHPKKRPEILKHLNVMLGSFQNGMGKTPEEQDAMKALNEERGLDSWLRHVRLLDPRGGKPTVAQMLQAGQKVVIIGDDGKPVTYTDKFFNNETVLTLQEEEKKTGKPMGSLMAAHMAMFFGESKKVKGLENMGTAFGGLNVVDARLQRKSPAYILTGDDAIVSVLEYNISQAVDEIQKKVKDLEDELEEEELNPPDDIGKEPVVPAMPREKNFFRRFVCFFGFPHSREYTEALAERERKEAELEDYREKKPEYDRQKLEYEAKVEERRQKKERLAQIKEDAKNNKLGAWKNKVLENARMNAEKLLPFINETVQQKQMEQDMEGIKKATDHERDMEKFRNNIPEMVLNEGTVQKLNDSVLKPFQPGSLALMLELIHYKGSKFSEPRMEEELLQSMDPGTAGFLAKSAVENNKFADASKRASRTEEDYLKQVDKNYKEQVDTARLLFYKVFRKEPTVENVKAVTETVGLEKHIKKQMEADNMNYEEKHQIPKIDESNVGDITLLLMTGLKGSVEVGKAKERMQPVDLAKRSMQEAADREARQRREAGEEQRLVVYQPEGPTV